MSASLRMWHKVSFLRIIGAEIIIRLLSLRMTFKHDDDHTIYLF